ncbi:MAG: DUF262 domain-containing protein [bacterium]
MKISTVLEHGDNGHIALPEFQRGFVWNRDQVRGLFDSLYRRHPVGGLLVWVTEARTAAHRGDGQLAAGVVKLLLDGQQRITSRYGIARAASKVLRRGSKGIRHTAVPSRRGDSRVPPADATLNGASSSAANSTQSFSISTGLRESMRTIYSTPSRS